MAAPRWKQLEIRKEKIRVFLSLFLVKRQVTDTNDFCEKAIFFPSLLMTTTPKLRV